MLFNSFAFIFCFLPIVLSGFYLILPRYGARAGFGWLILSSLFFYGWWNPAYLILLIVLMLANFYTARMIVTAGPGSNKSRLWLASGITVNLAILAYFKYADFLTGTVNHLAGTEIPLLHTILPLAISFFTFQKIAFLVDCYRGIAREDSLLNYLLFVGFFPQLIAGPIVHHQEIMPQFLRPGFSGADARMMAMGLTLFSIGLFKKAVLADCAAIPANMAYNAAEISGAVIQMGDAWSGVLAYAFQIYFDFSGYSDMAIGLALLFGVRLPENFLSPYKATGMIDFWRRWHMTLSRFLRDYLYISLGGSRGGKARQTFNVVVTMLLGGLWHGASWNFVLWGGLHGIFIAINHALRAAAVRIGLAARYEGAPVFVKMPWRLVCITTTFILVSVLWVLFRAESLDGALVMLNGLAGRAEKTPEILLPGAKYSVLLAVLATITLLLPNSMSIMFGSLNAPTTWRPSFLWGILTSVLLVLGLLFMQTNLGEEFIYFDF